MIRFLLGILVGIFIGAGGALKIPEINFNSPSEAIKDGVKEASKEIIREELEAQKKELEDKEGELVDEIQKLLNKI
tara:strand:+ start:139 stop:366 length:228 start_codon:yes stop_codon:yes gene_type:complete